MIAAAFWLSATLLVPALPRRSPIFRFAMTARSIQDSGIGSLGYALHFFSCAFSRLRDLVHQLARFSQDKTRCPMPFFTLAQCTPFTLDTIFIPEPFFTLAAVCPALTGRTCVVLLEPFANLVILSRAFWGEGSAFVFGLWGEKQMQVEWRRRALRNPSGCPTHLGVPRISGLSLIADFKAVPRFVTSFPRWPCVRSLFRALFEDAAACELLYNG